MIQTIFYKMKAMLFNLLSPLHLLSKCFFRHILMRGQAPSSLYFQAANKDFFFMFFFFFNS